MMDAVLTAVTAVRPWSFTISTLPILLVALSMHCGPSEQDSLQLLRRTCFVLASVLILHAGANLLNTWCDWKNGADTKVHADDRTLVDGHMFPKTVVGAAIVCIILAVGGFRILAQEIQIGTPQEEDTNSARMHEFATIVVTGFSIALGYSVGPRPLKGTCLAEIAVFMNFGPLLGLASVHVLNGDVDMLRKEIILLTLPPGILAAAVLHANNARDIMADRAAKIVTLAQVIGPRGCRSLFWILIYAPFSICAFISANPGPLFAMWGWRPLAFTALTLPVAADVARAYDRGDLEQLPQQVAALHAFFCTAMLLSMLPLPFLGRVLLGFLFVLGGVDNLWNFRARLGMVHARLAAAVPLPLHHSVSSLALLLATLGQIISGTLFIWGPQIASFGREEMKVAAQCMILFLAPVSSVVHDFWAIRRLTLSDHTKRASRLDSKRKAQHFAAAGCTALGTQPQAYATFESESDSEFIHFMKNICILGGLLLFCEGA